MAQSNFTEFGLLIAIRLSELNLTQRSLANELNVDERYLTDIIKGRRTGNKYNEPIRIILGLKDEVKDMTVELFNSILRTNLKLIMSSLNNEDIEQYLRKYITYIEKINISKEMISGNEVTIIKYTRACQKYEIII